MALSRGKKESTVAEVGSLLAGSKLTVFARYQGIPVKPMQQLRDIAKGSGTSIRVIKNRLFKKALGSVENLKHVDVGELKGQLLYAFNQSDEVAPAQNLAAFARANPQIEFVGAITFDGQILSAEEVKALAELPSKEQLHSQLIAVIGAPLQGFTGVMIANARGVLTVLKARASSL